MLRIDERRHLPTWSGLSRIRTTTLGLFAAAAVAAQTAPVSAEALLLVEADSGKVLHAENATYPWYPASLTKLMTAYVALHAVREGRMSIHSLVTMSERAHAQQPSKMGFKPGIRLTLDNALKILMVKSANDIAVAIAEGVSGSVENFAEEMNAAAQRLGMTQSSFVNPNGLPDPRQISSARDMAILARALIREFPEHDLYWHIPAIKFGKRVLRNYNRLIDRYPGADGMKTGFICASGFNLVASATRHGRRLISVVLGAPSSPVRAEKTARLLESGFSNRGTLSWLTPSLGSVNSLVPIAAAPPDLHDQTCGPNRRRPASEADEEEVASNSDSDSTNSIQISSLQTPKAPLIGPLVPSMPPIVVTLGPTKLTPKSDSPVIAAAPLPLVRPTQTSIDGAVAPTLAASAFSRVTLASSPPAAFAPSKSSKAVPLPRARTHNKLARTKISGKKRRR
jgi:D-alanyl-D-alanine carboxypeptidase